MTGVEDVTGGASIYEVSACRFWSGAS